jgi:hypothetical protein
MDLDRRPTVIVCGLAVAAALTAPAAARAADAVPPAPAAVRPPPEIDPASVVFFPDEGRLELKGQHLKDLRVHWPAAAGAGDDVCLDPKPVAPSPSAPASAGAEQCVLALPRTLAADAALTYTAPGVAGALPLRPARVVVDRLLPATTTVDLTSGVGRIPLIHPEAVASVDCAQARCELSEAAVQVRAIPGAAASLGLRLRLTPHTYVRRGDTLDTIVTRAIAVLHCPAAVISGPPLRHADGTRVVVRLDEKCGRDARDLRWTANGEAADVQRVETDRDAVYVQLGLASIEEAQVTIMATRPEPDGSVVAVAHAPARPAPQPRAVLELPGFGKIDFIPTNRSAVIHVAPVGDHARLEPLPIDDVYRVARAAPGAGPVHVRGEPSAGGFVALRFGYRVDTLPEPFASTDLAVLVEPLQRPLREASVPAPLGAATLGPAPLIELVCADRAGQPQRIAPGAQASIPFRQRDSCRLLIHRERLAPEEGTQDITVEVNVTKVDDTPRADAHVSERMVVRHGAEPRVFWLHGVKAQFDRLTVRVSHIVDEAHDVGGSDLHINLPSAQWAVVVGEGHLRFYATAAIPTGLFRITAPSDVLTLNFGALSRLTWLDRDGHEGLLGLEFGAMGIGLAATPGFPRTLAVLAGLGVSVPIGNRGEPSQASVNLHAWIAYELRSDFPIDSTKLDSPLASHWSFLFGPSITIGNVGTNL